MVLTVHLGRGHPAESSFSRYSPPFHAGDFVKTLLKVPKKALLPGVLRRRSEAIFDISSEDAFWKSFQHHAGIDTQEEEERIRNLPIVGNIRSVDYDSGTAVVSLWKRGEEYYLDCRPDEQYPLRMLIKISHAEFVKDCKKPFMMHKQLKLMTDVNDEQDGTVPLSLIMYQNKVVSDLLDRTENKGKAQFIDDNFHEVYEELQKITAEMGLASKKARQRPKGLPCPRNLPPNGTPNPESQRSVSKDMGCSLSTNSLGSLSGNELAPFSQRYRVPKTRISRLLASMADSTQEVIQMSMSAQKDMGDSIFLTDGSCKSGSGEVPQTLIDEEHELVEGLLLMANQYTVTSIQEDGRLHVSSCDNPEISFVAMLEGVQLVHSRTVRGYGVSCKIKASLEGILLKKRIAAVPLGFDGRGVVRLNVVINGMWLQRMVVSLGFARVADSLIERVRMVDVEDPHANELGPQALDLLLWHQGQAKKCQRGMWQM